MVDQTWTVIHTKEVRGPEPNTDYGRTGRDSRVLLVHAVPFRNVVYRSKQCHQMPSTD